MNLPQPEDGVTCSAGANKEEEIEAQVAPIVRLAEVALKIESKTWAIQRRSSTKNSNGEDGTFRVVAIENGGKDCFQQLRPKVEIVNKWA